MPRDASQPEDSPPLPPPTLPPEAKVVGRKELPGGFRFSLRTLFFAVTAAALLFGFAAVLSVDLNALIVQLLWLFATGWLVTGLFFARGNQRAFCIGATIVVATKWLGPDNRFWFVMSDTLTDSIDILSLPSLVRGWIIEWVYLVFSAVIAIANGYLCIYAKRYFDHANPPRNPR